MLSRNVTRAHVTVELSSVQTTCVQASVLPVVILITKLLMDRCSSSKVHVVTYCHKQSDLLMDSRTRYSFQILSYPVFLESSTIEIFLVFTLSGIKQVFQTFF